MQEYGANFTLASGLVHILLFVSYNKIIELLGVGGSIPFGESEGHGSITPLGHLYLKYFLQLLELSFWRLGSNDNHLRGGHQPLPDLNDS